MTSIVSGALAALAVMSLLNSEAHAMGLKSKTMREIASMPENFAQYPDLPDFGHGEIFAVFAHPDDELTLLAQLGDYVSRHSDRKVHWIVVSDGGKGKIFPGSCFGRTRSECRMWEAQKSAQCAGIKSQHFTMLPDGALRKTKGLSEKIWAEIDRIRSGPIAAIFTHDPTGLYGHDDHMAVHDAMAFEAKRRQIPMVVAALPEHFKKKMSLEGEAAHRPRPPITHKFDLSQVDENRMVCATQAHKSQRLLLWLMMQGLSADEFYQVAPREFFNLTPNND